MADATSDDETTTQSTTGRADTIEVFADVCCPFTHVGLRRIVAYRSAIGRDDVRLVVRSWPLEIVNGDPLDGDFIAEEIDELRAQVSPDDFVGFCRDTFPATSIPAMALAAAAYAVDAATGESVSLALRDALFEEGRDVADPTVLERIAIEFGVDPAVADPDVVLADHAEGVERGVIGSPHFFTTAGGFFCPSLDVSKDADGHLRITADPDGFDAFVRSCFG